jgi:prevent-host-death family protein
MDIPRVVIYDRDMTTRHKRRSSVSYARETSAVEQQIGIRDLKARLSEYVRQVKGGATVVVTEHGRPVARLVPEPASLRARLLALVEAGEIAWNGEPYAPVGPVARVRGRKTLADLIVEERDRE